MGAVGAVEVFCFFVAVSLNVLCYLLHALPKRWRACGCPQKLLYVSNRASNADVEHESYFALSSMDGRHLTTSHFLPRPWLLLLRALELAFFVAVLVSDGTTGDKFGSEFPWPAFFTSWCFVLFGAWALAGTALTAGDIWRDSRLERKRRQGETEEAEGEAAQQRKISSAGEKQENEEENEEEEWRLRLGGGGGGGGSEEAASAAASAAAATACSSAPVTPQRGGGGKGARNPRTATSDDDLEAADADKLKTKKNKPAAAPSPASSSVTTVSSSSSSADSRRPLTAKTTMTATTTADAKQRQLPPSSSPSPAPLSPPPLPMDLPHKLYSLLSSVAGPAAIFVALMYWLVLRRFIERANPGKPFDPVDAMLHGGNALFVALDALLARVPAASSHFQITLAYGTAYSIFIWSYERATGRFLYGRILAWSRPTAVGFYGFALPGALLACFAFWCLLAAGREALGKKLIAKKDEEAKKGNAGGGAEKKETAEKEEEDRERRRRGDDEEERRRTKERTQRWTDASCAALPSLAAATTTKADDSSSLPV